MLLGRCLLESGGRLVISGRGRSPVLQPVERALDDVAGFVGIRVERHGCASGRDGRDDGDAARGSEVGAHMVGVVCLVANQATRRLDNGKQRPRSLDVVEPWPPSQEQGIETALAVAEGVDLGRASAAREADSLLRRWRRHELL